jgi:transposase
MPLTKLISEFEKGQIHAYVQVGKNYSEIGLLLNRSRSAISKFMMRENLINLPKKRGRPNKLSDRTKRTILRYNQAKPSQTCRQIISNYVLHVSKYTIARLFKKCGRSWRKKKKQPAWKSHHCVNRLEFARMNQTWNAEWRTVIFSDEKKFNLDGPDGYKCYWHCLGKDYECYSKRVGGGKSLMIWCAFGYGGQLDLKIIRGNLNAAKYQQLLQSVNLPENGVIIGGKQFIFQQDNAPPHTVNHNFFNFFNIYFII